MRTLEEILRDPSIYPKETLALARHCARLVRKLEKRAAKVKS